MNNKYTFLMAAGVVAVGLCSPMAKAEDCTNKYFATPMSQSSVTTVTTSSPVVIEKCTSSPVIIDNTLESQVLIDKEITSPVILEKTMAPPVVVEDRVIKQKHMFGLGIWPLFDFELM